MTSLALLTIVAFYGAESGKVSYWHTGYSDGLGKVRRADKPLFMLFDGGSSSVVRLVGDRPVLSDDIERALLDDYICVYVDTGTDSGKALAARFGASELPFTLVIDRSGNWQMYRRSGSPSVSELLAVLAQFRRVKYTANGAAVTMESRSSAQTPSGPPSDPTVESTAVRTASRYYPPISAGLTASWCRT